MLVTLTKLQRFNKDRDGNPLKTKDGRPYTRLILETKEYPKSMSGFDSQATSNWKEGDQVEVEVTEKGEYLNFSLPKQSNAGNGEVLAKISALNLSIQSLGEMVLELYQDMKKRNGEKVQPEYPVDDLGEPPF